MPGVGGTWKDLTDNVNLMATNLTNQVRGIADVVTAVAQGNLKRKLTVDAKGESAALAETINFMIDTLSAFGDQVTNMAREVGIEGKLGGQARVPGAAGLWRDLTDNVNELAANLTNQVRSIAEVATAVTKGDLTRSIAVQASGEMAALTVSRPVVLLPMVRVGVKRRSSSASESSSAKAASPALPRSISRPAVAGLRTACPDSAPMPDALLIRIRSAFTMTSPELDAIGCGAPVMEAGSTTSAPFAPVVRITSAPASPFAKMLPSVPAAFRT